MGGLAEATQPFGGMLGSTFNAVFELQMENLQEGDRFYYIDRLEKSVRKKAMRAIREL